jgi:hypothetical protein
MLKSPLIQRLPAFSIAEVVLSGFMLTTGIVAVMSLYVVSHQNSFDTRNLITASELAQEGVEVARNVRDNNTAYRAKNWSTGDNCQASTAGNCDPFRYFPNGANSNCSVNYNSTGGTAFSCGGPQLAVTTNGSGFLHNAGGTATRFYRLIKINYVGPADSARIQSFVTWQNPGGSLNGGGALGWCTSANKCVYTELFLSRWK